MNNTEKKSLGDMYIGFTKKLVDAAGTFAAYLLIPLVIVFLIEIVARNVFNHPTTWAYGTCFVIGGCAAILGLAYAMAGGSMVRIDIIHSKLGEKTKCVLDLLLYAALFLPLTIGGSWQCIRYAIQSVAKMELLSAGSWNVPIWPSKIVMAVSMVLLTMHGISEIITLFKRLKALRKEKKA